MINLCVHCNKSRCTFRKLWIPSSHERTDFHAVRSAHTAVSAAACLNGAEWEGPAHIKQEMSLAAEPFPHLANTYIYIYIRIYIALTNRIIVELPGYILIFALVVLKGQIQPKLQLWLKQLSKQSGCQRISFFHNMYILIARWSSAWCVATPDPGLQSEATRATWAKTPEAILCQFFFDELCWHFETDDFARCNRRSVLGCKPVLWMFF